MTYFPVVRMHDSLRVGKPGGVGQIRRVERAPERCRTGFSPYNARMLSLVFGTIAFFVASYFSGGLLAVVIFALRKAKKKTRPGRFTDSLWRLGTIRRC